MSRCMCMVRPFCEDHDGSLADDPQAIERAWRCNNFRTAYLESSPILADRMAFCARGHSDENGHHGDEDGCGWVVLRAAEGEQ